MIELNKGWLEKPSSNTCNKQGSANLITAEKSQDEEYCKLKQDSKSSDKLKRGIQADCNIIKRIWKSRGSFPPHYHRYWQVEQGIWYLGLTRVKWKQVGCPLLICVHSLGLDMILSNCLIISDRLFEVVIQAPPSAGMTAPVMRLPIGLTRYSNRWAISDFFPTRWMGMLSTYCWAISWLAARPPRIAKKIKVGGRQSD